MPDLSFCPLGHRALLTLGGTDRASFLQGLVSADVRRADGQTALYGAFLTPQGKFLHDFFLAAADDRLLLEVERAGREDFRQRLSRFKLRAKIELAADEGWQVFALFGGDAAARFALKPHAGVACRWRDGLVMVDPRLAEAGLRAWLPAQDVAALADLGFTAADPAAWDARRIALGLADGSRDLQPEKTLLLEAGFDELHGVDWQKGCFMGQEVTARSKYRGQIRKRLLPVRIDGPPPPPGTPILSGGQEAGEMRSHAGQIGLAMLRLEHCSPETILTAGQARLTPQPPAWMRNL